MGRAQSKKLLDFLRGQELKRLQEQQKRLKEQTQIVQDYIVTHSKLAFKNEDYPLTEEILYKGNPEEIKKLLPSENLEVNPYDFPEGLVLEGLSFDVKLP